MSAPVDVGGIHPSGKASPGLRFDISGAADALLALDGLKKISKLAQKRAILTLKRKIGTETHRDIRRQYNIKQGRVTKDLRVSVSSNKLRITGYFRGIGLRNFSARQTKSGVTSTIFKGLRNVRPHAFFVGLYRGKNPKGNEHVALRGSPKRKMTAGNYVGKYRDPLISQYGPTVAQMLRKGRRPERLAEFAVGVLRDEVERQLKSITKGRPSGR